MAKKAAESVNEPETGEKRPKRLKKTELEEAPRERRSRVKKDEPASEKVARKTASAASKEAVDKPIRKPRAAKEISESPKPERAPSTRAPKEDYGVDAFARLIPGKKREGMVKRAPRGEKPSGNFNQESSSERPAKAFFKESDKRGDNAEWGSDRPAPRKREGMIPRKDNDSFGKSTSDRPARRDDKPFEKRDFDRPKRYDDKPSNKKFGDRPPRRDDRPFEKRDSDRPARRDDRPSDNKFGDRPPRRDDRPFEKRDSDRPRRFDDKPSDNKFGDRPPRRNDKPFEKRDSDRPRRFDDKPSDNKFGDRPARRDDRPFEKRDSDRPKRYDDKPSDKKFGDRPPRRDDRPFEKRDGEGSSDRKGKFGDRPAPRPRSGEDKDWSKPMEQPEFLKGKRSTPYRTKKVYVPTLEDKDGKIRLNKYISNAGICSRREADDMIKSGVIKVNGKIVTELGTRVSPDDKIQYGDETLNKEVKRYLLLNKPKDTITTANDPEGRKTVMELVKSACKERLYPVGRLDRTTTGLLLMTNDGDLAKKLTHPSYEVKKIYQVTLDKNLKAVDMKRILDGLTLEDGLAEVDEIAYVGEGADKTEVGIAIHSGKNRIVRRIFEHLGYEVVKLDRTFFAGLTKKDLPRGKFRFLTEKELIMLRMS
jgi:23S rRNA pseudouridine2605 synthase